MVAVALNPTNPSVTVLGRNAGSGSLAILGGLSILLSPVVGVIAGIFATYKIGRTWNELQQLQKEFKQKKIIPIDAAPLNDMKARLDYQLQLAAEKAENNDPLLEIEAHIRQKKQQLYTHAHQLAASILALVPVLGVFCAGMYLLATTPDIRDKGLYGAVEAIIQNLLDGWQAEIQGQLYIMRGQTLEQFYQKATDDYNSFLGAGEEPLTSAEYVKRLKTRLANHYDAKEVEIPVERGDRISHHLNIHVIPVTNGQIDPDTHLDPSKPTVVMFHGNGMTGLDFGAMIDTYQEEYNVVTVTMGGYPGSDESILTSEISTYQDAHAVMNYLKGLGATDVIAHGTSIGGTLAFAAADLHPDLVKVVVAHQTFNRAKDVAANTLNHLIGKRQGFLPAPVIRGAIGAAFPQGQIVPGVVRADGTPYMTDGLDNAKKASQAHFKAEVIVIKGEQDIMMGRNKRGNVFQEDFAEDILRARYKDAEEDPIVLNGGHVDWLRTYQDIDSFRNKLNTKLTS